MPTKFSLNVILHELFAVILKSNSNSVELYTPIISSGDMMDHVYWAGNWKREQVLQQDTAYALNINNRANPSTPPQPQSDRSIVWQDEYALDAALSYCNWHLPMPDSICQLRLLDIKEDPLISGRDWDRLKEQPNRISATTVLVYNGITDWGDVSIQDDKNNDLRWDWEPSLGHASNLHLWAESPVAMTDENKARAHSKMTFGRLMKLVGLQMKAEGATWLRDSSPLQPQIVDGVRLCELHTLGERSDSALQIKGNVFIFCTPATCATGGNIIIVDS